MHRKTFATAAFCAVVPMLVATGAAHAGPSDNIQYNAHLDGQTVVTVLDGGKFQVTDKKASVLDNAGRTVIDLPLTFSVNGVSHPLVQQVSAGGRELRLTPDMDPAKAGIVHPVASPQENLAAQQTFVTQLGIATAVGSLVGTAIGAVAGFFLGIAFAGAVCAVPPFIQCLVTTIPIIGATAGVGAILGTLAVGGTAVVAAGFDLVNTLTAPPGTTRFFDPTH